MEIWKPNVTVAAVVERDGRFLVVEEETDDGLRITGSADLRPAILHAYADHRMAHFAALLALRAGPHPAATDRVDIGHRLVPRLRHAPGRP